MPVDRRFFTKHPDQTLAQLAALCGAEIVQGRGETIIAEPAPASRAGAGDIAFYDKQAKTVDSISSQAGCCIVTSDIAEVLSDAPMAVMVHDHPRWAHSRVSKALFSMKTWHSPGTPAEMDACARIHPSATVCKGARIGADTDIGPGCYIGPGVEIGAGCRIGANVTIECALIGDHVTLLAGVHIGQSGFGVVVGPDGPEDIPHWGRVILGDHVSIGAGSCVDRGAFEDTCIGARTKIDNLCQIAHNVVLGENVRIASFTGISGSCTVGNNTVMGGGVGIADHKSVGNNVQLLARSGLMHNVPDGERWGGFPARPSRQFFRETAWLQKQARKKS